MLFPRSRLFGGYLMTYWDHSESQPVEVINGCFWIVRRAALEQVGLLDEQFFIYAEDMDWSRRFNEAGWKVVFFAGADALHHGGASSAHAPVLFNIERQRANHQYWQKHHSRLSVTFYSGISLLHHGSRVLTEVLSYPLRRERSASRFRIKRGMASIKWLLSRRATVVADLEKSIAPTAGASLFHSANLDAQRTNHGTAGRKLDEGGDRKSGALMVGQFEVHVRETSPEQQRPFNASSLLPKACSPSSIPSQSTTNTPGSYCYRKVTQDET